MVNHCLCQSVVPLMCAWPLCPLNCEYEQVRMFVHISLAERKNIFA
jgi:hypothetical protein